MLTAALWIGGLAGLLLVAKTVHDDVPAILALKLPLLKLKPALIFAGDSRMAFQVDPELAAQIEQQPPGYAVNIAYLAGEPLAFLAVARRNAAVFREARVVLSVTTLISNEGIASASVFPQDVMPRLGVVRQLATFLPMRVGIPIRYIREAFNSKLAHDEDVADIGAMPQDFGLERLGTQPGYAWPANISSHPQYSNWNLEGPKSTFEIGALCDLVTLTRRLTVVIGPWAPQYNRNDEPDWKQKDDANVALVRSAGSRCGFETLDLQTVPGLSKDHFADEQHLNATGIPIYTRYLMSHLMF